MKKSQQFSHLYWYKESAHIGQNKSSLVHRSGAQTWVLRCYAWLQFLWGNYGGGKRPFQDFSFHQGQLCLDNVLWLSSWEKKHVCGMCQFLRCKDSHHGWLAVWIRQQWSWENVLPSLHELLAPAHSARASLVDSHRRTWLHPGDIPKRLFWHQYERLCAIWPYNTGFNHLESLITFGSQSHILYFLKIKWELALPTKYQNY